jgi:serine/threonine-protein phosphatase 2A regulatory subunit A
LPGFCAIINHQTVLALIVPCIKALTSDASQHVRAAFAAHVSDLAPMIGKQNTIDHLLPLILTLLKDEASDVRLAIISKLDGINQGS